MNIENIEKVYEISNNRNKLVLFLLSKGMNLEEIRNLKISDITPDGINNIKLGRKEEIVLGQYIETLNLANPFLFPSKKSNDPVKRESLLISLRNSAKKANLTLADLDILEKRTINRKKYFISDEDITLNSILDYIKQKTAK